MSGDSRIAKGILKPVSRYNTPGEAAPKTANKRVRIAISSDSDAFEPKTSVREISHTNPGKKTSLQSYVILSAPSKAFSPKRKPGEPHPHCYLSGVSVTGKGRAVAQHFGLAFSGLARLAGENPEVLPDFLCEGKAEHLEKLNSLSEEIDVRLVDIAARHTLFLLSRILSEHSDYHGGTDVGYQLNPRSVKLMESALKRLPEQSQRLVRSIMYKRDGAQHEPRVMAEKLSHYLLQIRHPLKYDTPNLGNVFVMSHKATQDLLAERNRDSLKKCLERAGAAVGEAAAVSGQLGGLFNQTYTEEQKTMDDKVRFAKHVQRAKPGKKGLLAQRTAERDSKLPLYQDWSSLNDKEFNSALQGMNRQISDGLVRAFYLDGTTAGIAQSSKTGSADFSEKSADRWLGLYEEALQHTGKMGKITPADFPYQNISEDWTEAGETSPDKGKVTEDGWEMV